MIANLQNDYDESNDPSFNRALSVQEVFERVMEKELPVFVEAQEKAFEMMRSDLSKRSPLYQNRNSKSNRINENIKGLLYDLYPEQMKETPTKRFYFEKPGKYIILFKKLTGNLLPMNIATKSSSRILSQLPIEFTNQMPIIFVGYVPNSSWDSIEKICAVYISQGKIIWVSDLRMLGGGPSTLDLFDSNPVNDDPIIVRPKIKKSLDGQS
ncbi:MAG: hypothetical protein ACO1OQ_11695 [Rufibacter sp.]